MEWPIQDIARLAGTTSRTLRHYHDLGLVIPSRVGANGYRYYDQAALVRLQQVLVLRELGMGLDQIGQMLQHDTDPITALAGHLEQLIDQRQRRDDQIAAVRRTIAALKEGKQLMPEDILDGFDHPQYQEEVTDRWGQQAWEASSDWWSRLTPVARSEWMTEVAALNADWTSMAASDTSADSEAAQLLAERHVRWLSGIPGTPGTADVPDAASVWASGDGVPSPDAQQMSPNAHQIEVSEDLWRYVRGLAQMYVVDERFARNYGGPDGARFVQESLTHWLDTHTPTAP